MSNFALKFGLTFNELYCPNGIHKIDNEFLFFLEDVNQGLYLEIQKYRQENILGDSKFITELAPFVETFIGQLFNINEYVSGAKEAHLYFDNIYQCKRLFVQRQAIREHLNEDWAGFNSTEYLENITALCGGEFNQVTFANSVMKWLSTSQEFQNEISLAKKYAAWACLSKEGQETYKDWALFNNPKKKDYSNLVRSDEVIEDGIKVFNLPDEEVHSRQDFNLTDNGPTLINALDQTHYCIFCHNQSKDSCSKGLKDIKTGEIKRNELGQTLNGCPLDEHISEMNMLKSQGYLIGSLAAAVINNPMVIATGHRICNDCMKSCIFQKQDPVNVPAIESRVVKDVLELPWGFEIYSLLTKWNPLNTRDPFVKKDTGYKVLVAGVGPAGFTLSHYLLNEGHTVVAIDGLKIEPLPIPFEPINNIYKYFENLDTRKSYGFGGVAEYGITVRWDKNFLTVVRLLLERRSNFKAYGGVRFGSQISYDNKWFDHIALCIGAGRPNILDIPNGLANGIRTASDFLMSLQLTGAAKKQSIANLQLRLPVAVIGGGLTAVDTATEAIVYYSVQVKKFKERYNALVQNYGEKVVRATWTKTDNEIADEFISHAKLLENENSKSSTIKIVRSLGGVKVFYRKKLTDAPSYKLNHEEVNYAFKEGIEFVENAIPLEAILDEDKSLEYIKFSIDGEEKKVKARSAIVAIGTNPNTTLSYEDPDNFKVNNQYLDDIEGVSVFGDLHPKYVGNVVKAMASAKDGYKNITSTMSNLPIKDARASEQFFKDLDHNLNAEVYSVEEIAPKIIELVVKAPLAAAKFQPGQFYRLQNYSNDGMNEMEGIALTGAWVDKAQGLISTIVLEMGGSSSLCRYLKKGEPVVLMGPTGTPTEIKGGEYVMLIGGGLGNAVLFSIGKAFRDAGSKVLYFAGYKKKHDRYKVEEIEKAADEIIWCCDEGVLDAYRTQDSSFHGNIVDAINNYAKANDLSKVNRIIAIGSDSMMNAVNAARCNQWNKSLNQDHVAIASINSPMQCMMKEICGQCLQKHVDLSTGIETYVYSCTNQDQDMSKVDFAHLRQRLAQNSVSEKLSALFLSSMLEADSL